MTEIPEHLLKRARVARETVATGDDDNPTDARPSIPAHLLERSKASRVGQAALGGITADEVRTLHEATAPLEHEIHDRAGDPEDRRGFLGNLTTGGRFSGFGFSDEPEELNIFFQVSFTGHNAPPLGSNETTRTNIGGQAKVDLDKGKVTIVVNIDVYADDSADQVRELTLRFPQNLQQLQVQTTPNIDD